MDNLHNGRYYCIKGFKISCLKGAPYGSKNEETGGDREKTKGDC